MRREGRGAPSRFPSHFFSRRSSHFRPPPSKMRWFQVNDAWIVVNKDPKTGVLTPWVALRTPTATHCLPFGTTSFHGAWLPFDIIRTVELVDGESSDDASPPLMIGNDHGTTHEVVDVEVRWRERKTVHLRISATTCPL